ncbi:MAG: site-specific integrase [Bryobacterales bacterium]|nr:site-specific integrase [Bryobacterales bacterium]
MIKQLFKRGDAVRRQVAAPLVSSRIAYLKHCAERGAKPSTLGNVARTLVAVAQYLGLGEQGTVRLSELEAAAERWVCQDPGRRGGNRETARQRFLRHGAGWLRFAGRLEVAAAPVPPHADISSEFVDYMRREAGWSEATVRTYHARTEEFLSQLGPETHTVADITLADVDRHLGGKGAPGGCSRITLRNHVSALRAFFRFVERRGRRAPGLSAAITAPRVYRDAGLPVGPTADEVRRLLETTAGDSAADLRDRAVLLLLSSYGLRAGEVRGLRLDDIDWEAETFRVRRSKVGRTSVFPLSRRLGDALLRYLREARPHCGDREIFLALKAPVRALGPSGLGCIVRRRLQRIGSDCQRRGAHSLRHAFAQRLLDQDFSLEEIGNCLGHRSPESTSVYAKVHLAALRRVADVDLEGLA